MAVQNVGEKKPHNLSKRGKNKTLQINLKTGAVISSGFFAQKKTQQKVVPNFLLVYSFYASNNF